MRRSAPALIVMSLMLVLSGCQARPSQAPPSVSVPTVEHTKVQSQETPTALSSTGPTGPAVSARDVVAQVPLIPKPGILLVDQIGQSEVFSYSPIEILDQVVQPVSLYGGWEVYVRQDGDKVYLHGYQGSRGGWTPNREVPVLYTLPLRVGDTWTISWPSYYNHQETYRISGMETVGTLRGELPTIRVEVNDKQGELLRTEWWIEGVGMVQAKLKAGEVWKAQTEKSVQAPASPAIGRINPDQKGLLWDLGDEFRVTSLDGKKQFFSVHDNYWRSFYRWVQVDDRDLLKHSSFPGSWNIWSHSILGYTAKSDKFELVPWVTGGGQRTNSITGDDSFYWNNGSVAINQPYRYPRRALAFAFDNSTMTMKERPELTRFQPAESAEELMGRVVSEPPISEEDFISMWADRATAQNYLDVRHQQSLKQPFKSLSESKLEVDPDDPGRFNVLYGLWTLFEVRKVGNEFKIVSWKWAK